jgi:hypothetical protein
MELVAPNLLLLTVTLSKAPRCAFSGLRHASRLQALTLRGRVLFMGEEDDDDDDDLADVPYLPSLRFLHISGDYEEESERLLHILQHWTPSEHLLLSGFVSHHEFSPVFTTALGLPHSTTPPLEHPPLLHLPHLTFQPGECWKGNILSRSGHEDMLNELVELSRTATEPGNGTTVVRCLPMGGNKLIISEAWRDWEGVVDGGAGVWGRVAETTSVEEYDWSPDKF